MTEPTIAQQLGSFAVTTRDSRLSASALTNRGGPERPLSPDEMALKFRTNAERRVPREITDPVINLCENLALSDHTGLAINTLIEGFDQ